MLNGHHILFVVEWGELGGAERQALLLARLLRDHTFAKVTFCSLGRKGRASEEALNIGIPWDSIGVTLNNTSRFQRLAALLRFHRYVSSLKPTIVLAYTMPANVFGALTWRFTGAKSFIWNQRDEGKYRLPNPRLEMLATRFTPCFISNSGHGINFLVSEFGINARRCHLIHNGVKIPKHPVSLHAARKQFNLDPVCFVVGMVANITERKDHATLIRAWALVNQTIADDGSHPVLLLAGRLDVHADKMKALAFDLNLSHSVRFLGQVTDIDMFASAIDLCVHSSQNEGIPNGMLECMAHGKPVVASDIPGHREALGEECTEVLAPINNEELLAERILQMYSSHERREWWGTKNRARVSQVFSPALLRQKTTAVISSLLQV